ncbi:cellobiose dehydrogenase-like protein [Bisporella sp. PMI_857]|nr:cellobiose dehydrogenase-like protein [Bisporella sp. PMI_857]
MKYLKILVVAAATLVAGGQDRRQYHDRYWRNDPWDIIVVGAGPAGIIVADRLSAAGFSTLLLERGGPSYGVTGGDLNNRRPPWLNETDLTRVDVPGLYKSIFGGNAGDLTCGPVVNAYGGCTIGGSSAINAGLYFEPPESDYDLYFPEGWKSNDMINATRRLKNVQPPVSITSQDGMRYLQTGYDAARKWIVDNIHFRDTDFAATPNNKTGVFGHPVYNYIFGQRGGPVRTYLQSSLKRKRFRLQRYTTVVRVERNGNRATGVTVKINGTESLIKLSERGRVILSGGALLSPALLMYSGIGSQDVLATLQASGKLSPSLPSKDWINLPAVGAGLFDNPNTFIELEGDSIQSYTHSYDNPPPTDEQLYLRSRSGPYSFASQTSAFWDTLTHPDGRTAVFQGTIDSSGHGDFMSNKTITLNVYGTSGLLSKGRVVLDGNFIPGPDANVYYSDPQGQDAKDIASFIYKIFQGLPGSGLRSLNIPQTATKEEIEKYITKGSAYARGMVNHWSSSCRIGECVDVNTRVIGTENLHVVDGSIIAPLTVNPQFGIMAAAERASELILALYGESIYDG